MVKIRIVCEAAGVAVAAVLNESATAEALLEVLPVEAPAQRWGEELYFMVPVHVGPEAQAEHVEHGDIAYWPPGPAFCVFFGQQPVSAVNPLGRVEGDAAVFGGVQDGQLVRLELAD